MFLYRDSDIEVNGQIIPADTMVIPIMAEILKGGHWGPDAEMFRPERFLDEHELHLNDPELYKVLLKFTILE